MATPSVSARPDPTLRERVRERARLERRSFSNALAVLVEAGLAATSARPPNMLDEDEVERLAVIARQVERAGR